MAESKKHAKMRLAREMCKMYDKLKETDKDMERLDLLSKYKTKRKNEPFVPGDVVYHSYARQLEILIKLKPKKNLYYTNPFFYYDLTEHKGEVFRSRCRHITQKQIKEFVAKNRTCIYSNRCHILRWFMRGYADEHPVDGDRILVEWFQMGLDLCNGSVKERILDDLKKLELPPSTPHDQKD